MKVDVVKIVKIVSLVASILGAAGTAWANDKENKIILKELVEKQFKNQ